MTAPFPLVELRLAHGLKFEDLYCREGALRLDVLFVAHLGEAAPQLADALSAARSDPDRLTRLQESELLIALAPHLEDFIAELFGIEREVRTLAAHHHQLAPLHSVKRGFVQRRAMNRIKPEEAAAIDGPGSRPSSPPHGWQLHGAWLCPAGVAMADRRGRPRAGTGTALHYAAWAVHTPAGHERHRRVCCLKRPPSSTTTGWCRSSDDAGGFAAPARPPAPPRWVRADRPRAPISWAR